MIDNEAINRWKNLFTASIILYSARYKPQWGELYGSLFSYNITWKLIDQEKYATFKCCERLSRDPWSKHHVCADCRTARTNVSQDMYAHTNNIIYEGKGKYSRDLNNCTIKSIYLYTSYFYGYIIYDDPGTIKLW